MRKLLEMGLVLGMGFSLLGCGGSASDGTADGADPAPTPKSELAPKRFAADCADFLDYVAESLTNQYLSAYRCFADQACPMVAVGPAVDGPTAGPGSGSSSGSSSGGGEGAGLTPTRVSDTNAQEAGVDEADIVKVDPADGRIYVLSGQTLSVVIAFPPEAMAGQPLAQLALPRAGEGYYARDMYLDTAADRLVILGDSQGSDGVSRASAILVDIANPAAPAELGRLELQGWMLDSRRIGSRVHRVVSFQPPLPAWFYSGGDALQEQRSRYLDAQAAGDEAKAATLRADILAEIGRRTRAAGAEAWLPGLRQIDGEGVVTTGRMACTDLSAASASTALGYALVDSFSSDGSGSRATAGLVNNGQTIYASASNLYLLQPSSGWFFAPGQMEETAIYRLALPATGAARYEALGKVAGSVRNSYSLSEFEGHLRVASTESAFAPGASQSSSRLTVLDATSVGDLRQVGLLSGLAPGERLQGARLLGERGYLVTFRQIDPLFGIDLADPAKPTVLSELKLPGFSSHLQPLGDDWLLTVGRDGTDEGLTGQVAIQLFDVKDLAAIRQVASIAPSTGGGSYSYSVAEYDPHAFTYFPDSDSAATPGSLVLPLQSWSGSREPPFTGFLVVRVDPGASQPLRESGRISHDGFEGARDEACGGGSSTDGGSSSSSGGSSSGGGATTEACGDYYLRYAEPRRAVFQQDGARRLLYSISSVGIIASDADAPATEIARKELPHDQPCCFYVTEGPVP